MSSIFVLFNGKNTAMEKISPLGLGHALLCMMYFKMYIFGVVV